MKIINKNNSVWIHKYIPGCVDDLIIPQTVKNNFKNYIQNQNLPDIGLFSANPGTGKSSTAHAIIKEINGEALWVNASMEGIDILKGKIQRFAMQSSFDGKIKIVVMDEFDNMSSGKKTAQKAFRGFLDEYSNNCRFIFTGNYKQDIIEPLLDRMEVYDFNSFDKKEMIKPIFERLQFILKNENVQYNPKDLIPVMNTYYPSIRSMIKTLQKYTNNGIFSVTQDDLDDFDAFNNVMSLLSLDTYTDLISEINKLNSPNNMYQFLYKNAAKYFKPQKYPNVVMIIAKYQHMDASVRDKHLNLAAALTELIGLRS